MRYVDFFAGIGGFHSAFNRVGWECEGFCEIDKFARQSYKAMHDTEGIEEWHDITKVSDDDFRHLRGRVDIIAGGFPCQAFSVAGKRGGFEDTRGTLFFEVARAAKEIQPRYLLLENVKGLLNHDKGNTFGTILNTLYELGYAHIEWGVFNTKYWGVPQNRERVFILAELRNEPAEPYLLPLLQRQQENGVTARLRDVLETDVEEKYYLSEEKTAKLIENLEERGEFGDATTVKYSRKTGIGKEIDVSVCLSASDWRGMNRNQAQNAVIEKTQVVANLNHYSQESLNRIYGVDGQAPTIDTMQGGGREPKIAVHATLTDQDKRGVMLAKEEVLDIAKKRRPNDEIGISLKENGDIRPRRMDKRKSGLSEINVNHENNTAFTVTTSHSPKIYGSSTNYRIRKLTPLECWRLQDFTDEQFYKAKNVGVSDSQLYKQAGNSVTVKVVEMIAREIQRRVDEENEM